jgi:hypothetical protein
VLDKIRTNAATQTKLFTTHTEKGAARKTPTTERKARKGESPLFEKQTVKKLANVYSMKFNFGASSFFAVPPK